MVHLQDSIFFLFLYFIPLNKADFNQSSTSCFDPSEESSINLFVDWPAFQVDGSDGYCFDAMDFSYREGDSVWSCSGCLKYTCTGRPCQDRAGSKFKMFWVVESIGAQCCQSCDGVIFPPNTVMSTRSLGGECDLQEVVTCTAPEQVGVAEISYESSVCCSDPHGWLKVGETLLDPDSCSNRTCTAGDQAYWRRQLVFPGLTYCCVHDGVMIPEGGIVMLSDGEAGKCCLGQIGATTTSTTATSTTTTSTTITSTTTTTSTTTKTSTTTTTTTTTTAGSTTTAVVMQGHTLLRKIVLNTTVCTECWTGSLVMRVWGADDAVEVFSCVTDPLTVRTVGKSEHENDLGLYTQTRGCHWAPLDAKVSRGFLTWTGEGDLQADQICFEWLDSEKFPLECKVFENTIINCETNRNYQDLKCPSS